MTDFDEIIEDMPHHQIVFDRLLEDYNNGIEPLGNWATDDLIKLLDAVDRELQYRGEQASTQDARDQLDLLDALEEYDEDKNDR